MSDKNLIRDTADAVAGVVKAVPVYQDVVQPAAQEVGKALQTIAKTVHVALAPVSALVWGYDQIKEFVSVKVAERMKGVPPADIISPKPNVAGPALEALRYTGHEESLSELYANLLAASMNKNIAQGAHPAFVDIIKQLTSDEAKILHLFSRGQPLPMITVNAKKKNEEGQETVLVNYSLLGINAGCEFPAMTPAYIDNLCRLGLADVPDFDYYTSDEFYEPLRSLPEIMQVLEQINSIPEQTADISKKMVRVTELGKQFSRICVAPAHS